MYGLRLESSQQDFQRGVRYKKTELFEIQIICKLLF